MAIVRTGTVLTFTVQGTTGEYIPRAVESVRALVIDGLTPFFDVADVSIETGSFLSDPLHYLSDWPYTATVRATVRTDYGDIRDVDSIVANAFYNAAGNLPTVTADDFEAGQGDSATTAPGGLSLTTTLVLVVVALIAIAVIKFE